MGGLGRVHKRTLVVVDHFAGCLVLGLNHGFLLFWLIYLLTIVVVLSAIPVAVLMIALCVVLLLVIILLLKLLLPVRVSEDLITLRRYLFVPGRARFEHWHRYLL